MGLGEWGGLRVAQGTGGTAGALVGVRSLCGARDGVVWEGDGASSRLPRPISPLQKAKTVGAVERLTDTSKYTGSHKERFDESGKGKGKSGRENIVDTSGYVSAYKNAGTYDSKVKK